jgi:hypothetical protein
MGLVSVTTASTVVVLVVAVITIQKILTFRKLRHIPGPPLAGFTRLWLLWHSFGGQIEIVLGDASRKYG